MQKLSWFDGLTASLRNWLGMPVRIRASAVPGVYLGGSGRVTQKIEKDHGDSRLRLAQAKEFEVVVKAVLSPLNSQAIQHAVESLSLFLYSCLGEDTTGLTHAAVPSAVLSLLRLELVIKTLTESIHNSFVTEFNDTRGKPHQIRFKLRAHNPLTVEIQTILLSTQEALSKLVRGYRDVLRVCNFQGCSQEDGDSRLLDALKERLWE